MVNADLFYSNFTNTTFQKSPIAHFTIFQVYSGTKKGIPCQFNVPLNLFRAGSNRRFYLQCKNVFSTMYKYIFFKKMCSGWLKNYIFKCNENIFTNRKNLLHFTYSQKFEKKIYHTFLRLLIDSFSKLEIFKFCGLFTIF